MVQIQESNLTFNFDDSWKYVIKFDESIFYQKIMMKYLQESKAVDFVGIKNNSLYFIEVKHQENENTILNLDEKFNKIGQKIRDSLALIIGINCIGKASEEFLEYKKILCCNSPDIRIILWNENDWVQIAPSKTRKNSTPNNRLTNRLKKKLLWLTNSVFINSIEQHNPETFGFTVEPIT